MKKKKSSRTVAVPQVKKVCKASKVRPVVCEERIPKPEPAAEPSVVLPQPPPMSAQLQTIPMQTASKQSLSIGYAAMVMFMLLSLGANAILWRQVRSANQSINLLAAQFLAQQPVEISAQALAGDLQAYVGKRVRINSLALVSNHPAASQLAARAANTNKLSIDVYYENARNSPAIRALAPAPTKTVSITGTFNRYENDKTWYIEAETIQ
jgi:hypothetical protein